MPDILERLDERYDYGYMPNVTRVAIKDAAKEIVRLRATLRQIADSGNSINAHLAAQALETEHGNG